MQYEIRKRSRDKETWGFYACTDVATNAFEICSALNLVSGGEFAVFKDEKEVKSVREAMEI